MAVGRTVLVLLTSAQHQALRAVQAGPTPQGGTVSAGRYLAALLDAELQRRAALRAQLARDILAKYHGVPLAVAANAYQRCGGAVPLDELQSVACEEALKGARRYDPATGFSPAPLLRRWAEFGVRALLRARFEEVRQEVRPDQEQDGGGRWERLGASEDAEERGDRREQVQRLAQLVAQLRGAERKAAQALARGEDEDGAAQRSGLPVAAVRALRSRLAAELEIQEDAELTPGEAAQLAGASLKQVQSALLAGRLAGQRRGGRWVLRASEVRAWAQSLQRR